MIITLCGGGSTFTPGIVKSIALLGKHLSEGELLQLYNAAATDYNEETYIEIISKKTASLFATCTMCAAMSTKASEQTVKVCEDFGRYVGLAFQIKDDIFDYSHNARIGKPTGNDMKERKLTLPAQHVLNTYGEPRMLDIARRVRDGKASDDEISTLVDFTKAHGGLEYAEEVMHSYVLRAKNILDIIRDEEVRRALALYADYVANRDH